MDTPIPAAAAVVMGMSTFWCLLKRVLLQLLPVCLFEGEAKENLAVSPVLSFILHSSTPHIWGCRIWIFVI